LPVCGESFTEGLDCSRRILPCEQIDTCLQVLFRG
jgi:hypothetical protein